MLQITKKKKWPFVKMAEPQTSNIGDWCFGLGHPGGFDKDRGIVVRIGRVIAHQDETIQTDSRLLGGDSGGPLFDFEGRLIGIHTESHNYLTRTSMFQSNAFTQIGNFLKSKKSSLTTECKRRFLWNCLRRK